jgi:predicted branched-subunit amino acid permease
MKQNEWRMRANGAARDTGVERGWAVAVAAVTWSAWVTSTLMGARQPLLLLHLV